MAYRLGIMCKFPKSGLTCHQIVTIDECSSSLCQRRTLGNYVSRMKVQRSKSNAMYHQRGLKTNINAFHKTRSQLQHNQPFGIYQRYFTSTSIQTECGKHAQCDLQEMQEWIDKQRENIYAIPTTIDESELEYLCNLESNNQRRKFLKKLFKREQMKLSGVEEKKNTTHKNSKTSIKVKSSVIDDDTNENESKSFVLRSRKQTVTNFDKWRLAAAMKFGPDIALDFIYDDQMSQKQVSSVARQLHYVNKSNLLAQDPFHLHFVNCHMNGKSMMELKQRNLSMDNLMIDVTSKGLLDVFDQDDIIYICPDSKNVIKNYDPSKVYIVPAMCSEGSIGYSAIVAQVKQLDVAHGRFYGGSPNIVAQVNLLIAMNATRDFAKAFKMTQKLGKERYEESFSVSRAQKRHKWDING